MKKVIVPVIVLVLIAAGIGYYMYNKPVASLEKKQADVSITADQLLTDYETDEAAANAKYLGKVVEVTGKVASVTSEEGKNKVLLETANPISSVICELEEGKETADLTPGDIAKVKGQCTGYLSDVVLVQSTVEKL